jgi:hypothetical protein
MIRDFELISEQMPDIGPNFHSNYQTLFLKQINDCHFSIRFE